MSQKTIIDSARKQFPFELLQHDLALVDTAIRAQARAFDPAVEPYVAHVCNTSGKRIRPTLTFLSGGATGGITGNHHQLALILEMIHIATLVHDDIIDGAEIRRQAPTANAKWGNALSVLLGDILFAHALMLASEFEDNTITRRVAKAANDVCSGEIKQSQRRFDFQLSREDYFDIIRKKTAALFASAMELGAYLNRQPEPVIRALRDCGNNIGMAYQIYDDCLDLIGEENEAGKTLRTDLDRGKLTLPILNLIDRANSRQRSKLNQLLLQKEPIDVNMLAGIADYEGAIESAVDTGVGFIRAAREDLLVLPANEYTGGLARISRFLETLLDSCRQ